MSRFFFSFLVLGLIISAGCPAKDDSTVRVPPAVVSRDISERELTTITLSEDAVRRLGIDFAPVAEKNVERAHVFGGEIVTPPGQSVVVAAPWSGTLLSSDPATVLLPGMAVKQGETIFMIQPVLSAEIQRIQLPQMLLDARQRVEAAQIELEAENLEWNRAKQLLEDRAGSQQAVDMAETKVKLAQQTLETAKSNLELMEDNQGDLATVPLTPQPIVAPVSGILNALTSVAGQTVVQGSPLFDIVNTDQFWVRVPIYVGRLREIDTSGSVSVREYGQTDHHGNVTAEPVIAPPSANPNTATVDLYYALQAPEPWIRPGHKVAVQVPLAGETKRLTVPWSSVVFDIHGGSWVYHQVAPQTFTRLRVEIEYVHDTVDGSVAVLRRGPPLGTPVVIAGVAEIFSTEFGGMK